MTKATVTEDERYAQALANMAPFAALLGVEVVTTPAPMRSPAETLLEAGWTRSRSYDECGEALTGSGVALNGLACKRRGAWKSPDEGSTPLCSQHALKQI